MSYNKTADNDKKSRAERLISAAGSGTLAASYKPSVATERRAYKDGGRCYESGGMIEGDMPSMRRDRSTKKKQPSTTVNVIVAQKPNAESAMPPIPQLGGLGGPPAGAPAPVPPLPLMGRKDGGRIMTKMDAGAGSGEGRLEKIKNFKSMKRSKLAT